MKQSTRLLVLAALSTTSKAVLYGDEIYGNVEGGKFWTFYEGGVAIVDPEMCQVDKTITTDHNGESLPASFNDGIYMQDKTNKKGYVLIGSRVDETNELGEAYSHMYAFSTNDQTVITKAEVG